MTVSERIGILGGTFNPIHNGHLHLAAEAQRALHLDRVLLIPTYVPPHKRTGELAGAEHRLAMCRLAAQDLPGIEACDYEIREESVSYTVNTLNHLRRVYPKTELWLIMGTDMFLTLQEWRNPGEIIQLAGICAAVRGEGEREAILRHRPMLEAMGAHCEILDAPPFAISSTQIRELLRNGGDISLYLPTAVRDYLYREKLYGTGEQPS